uniref:Uncharacterized protein n=1 Tax=Plectus sambesii TaxID=2011161 RepID=A0A914WJM5_9BILA
MTRSVVLSINRPSEAEVAQFAQKKAALVGALGRSCLYAELVTLRHKFRYGGDVDKVKERVSALFSGLFTATWSRIWAVYEPTFCFTYYLLRQLGEKKAMRKLILPFIKDHIILMLHPPTVLELLKKVKVQLLTLPKEQRIVEMRHFLKLTTKLAVAKTQVLLIAYNRADTFLKEYTGEENSFQDLLKHRKADILIADSRQHFPKDKLAVLLPRTRASGHMYQLVPSMYEFAESVDGDLITLVKEAWSLYMDRNEGGTPPPVVKTPRARLANVLRCVSLNAADQNVAVESADVASGGGHRQDQQEQRTVDERVVNEVAVGVQHELNGGLHAEQQHDDVVSATPKRQYRKREVKVTKQYSLRKQY